MVFRRNSGTGGLFVASVLCAGNEAEDQDENAAEDTNEPCKPRHQRGRMLVPVQHQRDKKDTNADHEVRQYLVKWFGQSQSNSLVFRMQC